MLFGKNISKIASKEIFDPKLAYTVIKIRVSLSYDLTIENSTEHRLQTGCFESVHASNLQTNLTKYKERSNVYKRRY